MSSFSKWPVALAMLAGFASACDRETAATGGTPLRVAAASDLKFALDTVLEELMAGFAADVSYGSSGNLRTKIENGAPFDLFLSADMALPQMLAASGRAEPDTLFPYAVGRLVIWVPNGSSIDVARLQEKSLLHPAVRKIAVANPRHAPYGRAAVAALENYGLLEQVEPLFVLGENVAQTAQFVESGAADIGIIALSLAVAPAMINQGRFWEIPLDRFPTLLQGGVITADSPRRGQAEELREVLMSPAGRQVLERFGFIIPAEETIHRHATD